LSRLYIALVIGLILIVLIRYSQKPKQIKDMVNVDEVEEYRKLSEIVRGYK
jgi:hypothetical protein